MTECEQLQFRVKILERDLERKQSMIDEQAAKLDRLTAWIDLMLQAAEVRQDELVARIDERTA